MEFGPLDKDKYVELSQDYRLEYPAARGIFLDPRNSNRCIKIMAHMNNQDFGEYVRLCQIYEYSKREYKVLPAYYGIIQTNLGQAIVHEFIRDYDGSPSIRLHELLRKYYDSNLSYLDRSRLVFQILEKMRWQYLRSDVIAWSLDMDSCIIQRVEPGLDGYRLRIVDNVDLYRTVNCQGNNIENWNEFLFNLHMQHPDVINTLVYSSFVED